MAAALPYLIPLLLGGLSYAAGKKGEKQPKATQYPLLSPEQTAFQNKILQMLGGNLGEFEDYETFAAPYKRQFNEETVPGIAERFAGLGGLSSSGFTQSLGKAGAGLNEGLASLFEQMKQQRFQGLLPYGFQNRSHTDVQSGGTNWLAQLLGPVVGAYGQRLGQNIGQLGFGGGAGGGGGGANMGGIV